MISCMLMGPDEVHDKHVSLPAVPRVGEKIHVAAIQKKLRVTDVMYYINLTIVDVWVEYID